MKKDCIFLHVFAATPFKFMGFNIHPHPVKEAQEPPTKADENACEWQQRNEWDTFGYIIKWSVNM